MKTIILKRDSYRVYEEGKMVARFETEKEAQDFIGVQEEVAVSGVPYKVPLNNVKAPSWFANFVTNIVTNTVL